jgi:transcription initiation factor TFIID subunit 5
MESAEEIDKIVLFYLNKKGYKNAEAVFKQESRVSTIEDLEQEITQELDASVSNFILFHQQEELNNPAVYEQSYGKLKRWIEDSLDLYKVKMSIWFYLE